MGDPAYDARRAAERAEADERERRQKLYEDASLLVARSVVDFLEGRAFLIVEEAGDGTKRIAFAH